MPSRDVFNPVLLQPLPTTRRSAVGALCRQFASDAAVQAAEFVAHGMPATFVVDLEQRIATFEAAL